MAEPPASLLPTKTISIDALMRTKFYLPRTSRDIIPRDRLLERLNTVLSGKITLVCTRWFWQDNLAGRVAQVERSLNSLALIG